jgi:D-alanyl-D-alanine carboxypeptidase
MYPGQHVLFEYTPAPLTQFMNGATRHRPIPYTPPLAPAPTTTAEGLFVVEPHSWTPILTLQADTHFFPASTTKMITALTALDLYSPEMITSVRVATTEGQLMNLQTNERISIKNLLSGALIQSANDAAYALAWIYNDPSTFITHMNTTAQRIGMRSSHFTNPAGFDDADIYTTPRDLAFAGRAILQNPLLRSIVSTRSFSFLDEDYTHLFELTNTNQLLGTIEGVAGIKTGLTEAAGQNLVTFYRDPRTSQEYIIVVMKSKDRFADTRAIITWIQKTVSYADPLL